jgi:hypothetical protein
MLGVRNCYKGYADGIHIFIDILNIYYTVICEKRDTCVFHNTAPLKLLFQQEHIVCVYFFVPGCHMLYRFV